MSNEYVTQSSKCKYVVDSLAIVVYQILNWWNKVEFFCAPVVEGMVQHQEYTCWDHCDSRSGSHNFERKASSDSLNLKINYYFPLVSDACTL